jgi:NTE family protein
VSGDPRPTAGHDAEAFLAQVPLFAELPNEVRRELAGAAQWVHLAGGEYLFHQGDAADTIALVWSGRLQVIDESSADGDGIDGPPAEAVIGLLGRGKWVGELSLLTGEPRSAAIRALRDCELLIVPAVAFNRVLEREPELGVTLARTLAGQLQQSPSTPAAPTEPDTICVIALGDNLPADRFVWRLSHYLAGFGPVAVLGANGAVLQSDGPNRGPCDEYAQWAQRLDELESEHPWVILEASDPATNTEWATFCMRSSDRILALVRGGRPPELAAHLVGRDRTDVVFVGSTLNASRVTPTIEALRPRAHHHLPENAAFDRATDRIARRATGHALGIVFSGGGARGLAHLGVIERLVEAGAPLDRVGGCSAGAFAAGLYAMGRTPKEMIEICREELAAHHPFTDFTMPREALIKGRKAMAMLTRVFGDTRIEELSMPMFAVSADLATGELVVHDTGYLRDAVAASMSIPGFAPPIRIDGQLLVDGGLLDNLPVDVMVDKGEGPVIGVDVMRQFPLPDPDIAAALTGQRTRGMFKELVGPGIVSTIARSMVLGGWQRAEQNRRKADLLISPAVDQIGLFEFDRIDEAIVAGRAAADEALTHGLPH